MPRDELTRSKGSPHSSVFTKKTLGSISRPTGLTLFPGGNKETMQGMLVYSFQDSDSAGRPTKIYPKPMHTAISGSPEILTS